MSDKREIRGLENIVGNSRGMLHDIHEPGRDGPDDRGASPFWRGRRIVDDLEQFIADARADQSRFTHVEIITTRGIKARYAAMLEQQARERNEAAYEWSRLRWWQWRKRKRLWRTLFGIGGWRVDVGPVDYGIPSRVARCGRFIKRYREGGC